MLDNWLRPLDAKIYEDVSVDSDQQILGNIEVYVDDFPSLHDTDIVILGIGDSDFLDIRKQFYQLPFRFNRVKIVDIGNFKKSTSDFFIPVLKELNSANIIPIILSNQPNISIPLIKVFAQRQPKVNVCSITESLKGFDWDEITSFIHSEDVYFQSFVGLQFQLLTNSDLHFLNHSNIITTRLSELKGSIHEAEPSIRDADVVSFDLNVLKKAESKSMLSNNPNGLFTEEASQLMRYAGFSEKVGFMSFSGWENELIDKSEASFLAQMMWFFIEGVDNRTTDYPNSMNNMKEYIVFMKDTDVSLLFWKSTHSGRWWVGIPDNGERAERHKLIPCSLNDYKMAKEGVLSKRIIKILERT